MKLQMNRKGAWADVVEFAAKDEQQVKDAAQFLAKVGGVKGVQIKDDGIEVCWCMKPDYRWELPHCEY